MTTAWFQCFSGIAGDMALAALFDAGADRAAVFDIVMRVPHPDGITVEAAQRGGIRATRVIVPHESEHHHRPYREVLDLLAAADLPARVHERAVAVFERLALA